MNVTTEATSTRTLSDLLESDRLESRIRRATAAATALRVIDEVEPARRGHSLRYLRVAIADFDAHINSMNARLRDLNDQKGCTS
jgi:hypothetical protein